MVAQQVLRAALLGALASFAAAAEARAEPGAGAEEVVLIIDLQKGSPATRQARRSALEEALEGIQGVAATEDRALAAALAGQQSLELKAQKALADAKAAFGELDCATTEARAREAVRLYAALDASGEGARDPLRRAYVYRLLCADKFRDVDLAMRMARQLRALESSEPPEGVPEAVWSAYPELDASAGVLYGKLSVATEPAGAEISIDHRPVGTAPLEVELPQGEHLVVAAKGGSAEARFITLEGFSEKTELSLPSGGDRWRDLRDRVDAWRLGEAEPSARSIGALLAAAGARFALVLSTPGKIEVWAKSPRSSVAALIGSGANAMDVSAIVLDRARAFDRGPAPDPDVPLMREDPSERDKEETKHWWVYGSILGAAVLAGIVIGANELGSDRQRFEVTFP